MRNINRYIVKRFGEEESIEVNGKIIFINSPVKKSLKIYSFPKWKFRKKNYANKLRRYNITCVDRLEYSLINILFYLLMKEMEKFDCVCFGFAGFDYLGIEKAKQFLLELEPSVYGKLILIVVEEKSIEEEGILTEFPIYQSVLNGSNNYGIGNC